MLTAWPCSRTAATGIVNLSGHGILLLSVARQLGSGTPLLAYRAAPLKPSEAGKKRPGFAKLAMRRSAILAVALHQPLRNALIGGYYAFVAAKLVVHSWEYRIGWG